MNESSSFDAQEEYWTVKQNASGPVLASILTNKVTSRPL